MPVSFKDKHGKKHKFKDHDEFVSWLKKNRPEIKDPDAFAAEIERRQRKGDKKEMAKGKISRIIIDNLITGELFFSEKDDILVKNIEIYLVGIDVPLVTLEPEKTEFGAKFGYVLDSRARVGEYSVVWNITITGKDDRVVDKFFIGDDNIDRTLPLELQHLA